MATSGRKARVSAPPPRELNVRKFAESRASELEGLHSVVAGRLGNNFQSQRNKRKRTTGHDNRVAKKRFRKRGSVGEGDMDKRDSLREDDKISRRVRRSIELKKNLPCGFSTSGDGTKRLRTHVWHAKRFTMTKLWGFHIPLGLHGRGRGSRALLKKLKHGVLVHDASYFGAVQLEGPEDTLASILSSVLVPSPSSSCEEDAHDILVGNIFGTAMLHHAGKPCLPPIAPVTYMWRPRLLLAASTEGHCIGNSNGEENIYDHNNNRQVWVWIHAAAFKEAYNTLGSACESQMNVTGCSAHCISLEGQLGKLEVIGSKASMLLQKVLRPAGCTTGKSWNLKKCSTNKHDDHGKSENTSSLENFNQISSAVIPLLLDDPRTLNIKGDVVAPEGKSLGSLSHKECENKEKTVSLAPLHETECASEHSDLWDANEGICPPMEESALCMEKHQKNKEFIRVGHKSSVTQSGPVNGKYSRLCPVLLLKNENHEDSIMRCSIILPLSWVKAFWLAFISNGANAIGLRERQWVASEIGLPSFPIDFPDCDAYSHIKAMEAVAFNDKAKLCPPSKRPPEVPIPPPWDCVNLTFERGLSIAGSSHNQVELLDSVDEKIDQLAKRSSCGESDTTMFGTHVPFQGIVSRTSHMLSEFLNKVSSKHLILFPRIPGQRNCLHKSMKEREFLKQEPVVSEANSDDNTKCYVRVIVHAYKEGAFDEGAVVCAPRTADITLWTVRSESDDKPLQIPPLMLESYFTKLPSGKWELQVPEDPELFEHFRWPIGFITTGFVRGSKKAKAVALCEASLLSHLREEQWKASPVRRRKKEIYVLVRNLKSTAYRRALATVVLEQQEEDIKFM